MILKNPNQCPGRKVGAFSFGVGDDWEDEMIQRKNPPCLGMADFELLRGGGSEPAFATGDVGGDEFIVGLGEVDDSFDESDGPHYYCSDSASQHAHQEHDQTLFLVSEVEFVNSQTVQEDTKETGDEFFLGSRGFFSRRNRGRWNRFCGHCSSPLLSRCGHCKPQAL